jgi:hypothetical protein
LRDHVGARQSVIEIEIVIKHRLKKNIGVVEAAENGDEFLFYYRNELISSVD